MASDKRASMREGPLAALFARTEPKKKNEPPAEEGSHATPAERLRDAFAGDPRRDPATRAGQLELERNGGTMTPKAGGPVLRVVGVGGAVNTDLQSLQQSGADLTLAIGQHLTHGRGSGSDPSVGRQSAIDDFDRVKDALKGSDMVFVTAGAGGGTRTGAAPIVARVARELGALTVGIVTTPFAFEGKRRAESAQQGIDTLGQEVDTLIVVPNERLLAVLDKQTSMVEAFRVADDVLRQGVQGISDLITLPGLINLDFADVRTIMSEAGPALLGIGIGTGEHRAGDAAMQAVDSPLLETSMEGARSILLSITGGTDLSLWEVNEAAKAVSAAAHPDANIIFGATVDEKLGEQVWVTVVATGYGDRGRRKSLSRIEGAGEVRVKRSAPAPLGRGGDLDVPEFLPGR